MNEMTPERRRAIERVYHRAMACPEQERGAFLDRVCAGEDALRREVELLLAETPTLSNEALTQTVLPPDYAPRREHGDVAGALAADHVFGPYVIERLLGRGGMGEVYAATERESGRRVALKVLHRPTLDPIDRARFLREGRLAAALSHPHCVYIFGTAEIEGVTVIAMELTPGGTLKDRVRARGPLPSPDAVDAILQVIAGLDAAAAAGILHRDVKPSNCFVDSSSRVKIGDFGLSISTLARGEPELTEAGALMGTPAFAAPEQLRGEALDVRADIYAVGATLYYLLTGRAPIEESNLVRLVARVAQETPRSPRAWQPSVPKGLAAIVLRCLAKDSAKRFATYAALAETLAPFTSRRLAAADVGRRFAAAIVDFIIVGSATALIIPSLVIRAVGMPALIVPVRADRPPLIMDPWFENALTIAQALILVAYFGTVEGRWGRSIGKAVCGMKIAAADGGPPDLGKVWLRSVLLVALVSAFTTIYRHHVRNVITVFWAPGSVTGTGSDADVFALVLGLAVAFATARPRNGYAGIHELLSGTRVVLAAPKTVRTPAAVIPTGGAVDRRAARLGPFAVLAQTGVNAPRGLVVGYDELLKRYVWIDVRPRGAPAVPTTRRDLDRPCRLRWLAGSQAVNEVWDAYESIPGQPALSLTTPQSWAIVRDWLRDLTEELRAGLDDGSLPDLSVDHVWVGVDGRVRLLDWPASEQRHRGKDVAHSRDFERVQRFVQHIAVWALERRSVVAGRSAVPRSKPPLPLSAAMFFRTLDRRQFENANVLAASAAWLAQQSPEVSRWNRLAHLVVCMVSVLLVTISLISWMGSRHSLPFSEDGETREDFVVLRFYLGQLQQLDQWERQSASEGVVERRQALETYISGRFRQVMQDMLKSRDPVSQSLRVGPLRARADELLRRPMPAMEEMARAEVVLRPLLSAASRGIRTTNVTRTRSRGIVLIAIVLTVFGSVISPIAFRGGLLLRLLGIGVVTDHGNEPSRLRAAVRALVAWTPCALFMFVAMNGASVMGGFIMSFLLWTVRPSVPWIALTGLTVFVGGGLWAACLPARGPQDWLARTWLVPR